MTFDERVGEQTAGEGSEALFSHGQEDAVYGDVVTRLTESRVLTSTQNSHHTGYVTHWHLVTL